MPSKRIKELESKSSIESLKKPAAKRKMASSSVAEISSAETANNSNPIYFWREYGSKHCFLSQWYRSDFTTDDDHGIVYKNAEQYMMYHKAMLFNDHAIASKILAEIDPKTIKGLGRAVKNFSDTTWLANRERIVEEASYFKFKNGKTVVDTDREKQWEVTDLRKALMETGERLLVEASPFDKIWGVGFAPDKAEQNRKKWGLNLLGKALMDARVKLRAEEITEADVSTSSEVE